MTTPIDPAGKRTLGTTRIRVSCLGIGGGSSFIRAGDEHNALVDAAWNAGLRYFDTAPLYGDGESERRLGSGLARFPRSAYVLSTKVGRLGTRLFDYGAVGILDSLRRSRDRLGIERIDIVYLHDIDPEMHGDQFEERYRQVVDDAWPALARLRDEGTIGAIGAGLKDWAVALRLARDVRPDCIMLAGGYTLLQHGGLDELLPWCATNDVSIVVAAPYNTGILATGAIDGARYYYLPAPPEILARTRRIEAVCARHGVRLAAAALQFPLHHPAVASVVVGHEHASEVGQNVALLRLAIPDAFWAELRAEGLVPAGAPTP
jgi:D-threo-aldose 1-dehydrogenase